MDNLIDNKADTAPITKILMIKMVWCLALSLFWVIFLWGVWDRGVYALGINAFLFWLSALALFFWVLKHEKHYNSRDLVWLIPLGLIALSFSLYENPFIKGVNMLLYPLLFAALFHFGFLSGKEKRDWNLNFIFHFLKRFLVLVTKVNSAVTHYFDFLLPKDQKKKRIFKKIMIGTLLFAALASVLIVPLLSSADAEFSARMELMYDWIGELISETLVYKIIV